MTRTRGTGSVYRRAGSWWIKFYRDGQPFRESARTIVYDEAVNLLKRRLGEVEAGKPISPRADRVTVGELLDDYAAEADLNGAKDQRHVKIRVKKLKSLMGRLRAQRLPASELRAYIMARRTDDKASNATINRELAVLRRAYNIGLETQKIHHAPKIKALRESGARSGFFERAAFDEVLALLKEEVARDIALLGYWTGWRLGDLLGLENRQVDMNRRSIVLEPGVTKGGEGRIVFPPAEAWAVVEKWHRRRVSGRRVARKLFHRDGEPVRSFRSAWKTACKDSGHPGMLFHDLRRTAVRNMVRKGIPELVAMKISGHKTRSVFDRYNIVTDEDLLAARARMEATGTISGTKGGF